MAIILKERTKENVNKHSLVLEASNNNNRKLNSIKKNPFFSICCIERDRNFIYFNISKMKLPEKEKKEK